MDLGECGLGRLMLSSSQELADVVKRVAGQDREAFELLYRATSAKLYGVIVRIVVNRSTADEILQEVYVRVWQHAGDFESSRSSPITWMASIARNRAIDEIRKTKGSALHDTLDDVEVADELKDPLQGQSRSEDLKALIACLKSLGEERRQMILLAYYRGMSRDDLARRFSRPVPTVKTWLHRGLAQLKTCLST